MHIYIDESGNFSLPSVRKSKVSSVTSLTIPECHFESLSKKYLGLRSSRGYEKEVKGSRLTEKQIADTISLLRNHDVLLDIICIDVGMHSEEEITQYKSVQADKLIEHLTDEHHENLVRQVYEYREQLLRLSNQLFIQAVLTIQLVERTLNTSTLYYCQRMPRELGNFVWFIDAKNDNGERTPFEELWSTLLMPILETNFKMDSLEGCDYSYLAKYEIPIEELTPHQKSLMTEKSVGAVSLNKLIKDQLSFSDSASNIGLQLVDIMASAFNRAMNGTLKYKGWRHLGALTVQRPSMVLLGVGAAPKPIEEERHMSVLRDMKTKRKPMLTAKDG
jgi:hypothetical protein